WTAMKMRVEVDCAGKRLRVTAGTLQAGMRDLHVIPVPPSQAAWSPSAMAEPVCRIAGAP
ncbi:MAG TPA: hypothetical protein VFJ82_18340, partial [Longimicrobium sp.]|nr:hypothetical protein [Longimicrobium sp.]